MDAPILQSRLPFCAWMSPATARLPGIQPAEPDDWLRVDDAFAGQMGLRDRLLFERPALVAGLLPEGQAAAAELYAMVLDKLARTPGYVVTPDLVQRPDGVTVPLNPAQPMQTLGRLVQEDLCLMQADGAGEHRLTGAVLCFPASWTLAEKLGRPLTGIHVPVQGYAGDLARRVQRLFDMIRPGAPLWRANALVYRDPSLHQPRAEADPRSDRLGGDFVRSERQVLLRLPQTGAVLFSIHTYVVRLDTLSAEEYAGLMAAAH